MRIPPHSERNLLRSTPSFKLPLPRKSLVNIIARLPTQQACHVVPVRESLEVMELVLEDPLVQIPAEPHVERAGEAAHDLDAVGAAISRHAVIVKLFGCGWL